MSDYDFFVAIVAGEKPEQLMTPYDAKTKVKPYVVYRYEDAKKLRQHYLDIYTAMLNTCDDTEKEEILENIELIKETTDENFYYDLTCEYDLDENGNAISTANKNGKWSFFQGGKMFSVPFITYDGREVFQAKKSEIDWDLMHLHGKEIYEIAWEMVMENRKPNNDYEQQIYDNMKNRTAYFNKFGTKEQYVIHSTAFWGYAFLSKETGWCDIDDAKTQFEWVSNFYERFIDPLDDDTLLTIYECRK